jgi:hypothetical protein
MLLGCPVVFGRGTDKPLEALHLRFSWYGDIVVVAEPKFPSSSKNVHVDNEPIRIHVGLPVSKGRPFNGCHRGLEQCSQCKRITGNHERLSDVENFLGSIYGLSGQISQVVGSSNCKASLNDTSRSSTSIIDGTNVKNGCHTIRWGISHIVELRLHAQPSAFRSPCRINLCIENDGGDEQDEALQETDPKQTPCVFGELPLYGYILICFGLALIGIVLLDANFLSDQIPNSIYRLLFSRLLILIGFARCLCVGRAVLPGEPLAWLPESLRHQ